MMRQIGHESEKARTSLGNLLENKDGASGAKFDLHISLDEITQELEQDFNVLELQHEQRCLDLAKLEWSKLNKINRCCHREVSSFYLDLVFLRRSSTNSSALMSPKAVRIAFLGSILILKTFQTTVIKLNTISPATASGLLSPFPLWCELC